MKMTRTKLIKLNCYRWKKVHFHLHLTTLNIIYIATPELVLEDEDNEAIATAAKLKKWKQDKYLYKHDILNAMVDSRFNTYQHIEKTKKL